MKSKLRVINAARVVGLFALIAVAILAGAPSANAATFDVNFSFTGFNGGSNVGTINVTGTIVATCDTCLLTDANITTWTFMWGGPSGATASGSGVNVQVIGGSVLSASGDMIQFIEGSGASELFTDPSTTAQIIFGNFGSCDNCIHLQQSIIGGITTGTVTLPLTIATEEVVTTTPLPAALPLFATGLGGLGLLGWRRRRKAAVIAA